MGRIGCTASSSAVNNGNCNSELFTLVRRNRCRRTRKLGRFSHCAIGVAALVLEVTSNEISHRRQPAQKDRQVRLDGRFVEGTDEAPAEPRFIGQKGLFDPDDAASADEGVGVGTSALTVSDFVDDDGNIVGDVSWLLDFAVIGNSKCGTTFLMHWLAKNPDTIVDTKEICALSRDDPAELVMRHFEDVGAESNGKYPQDGDGRIKLKGLKCPRDISTEFSLENYAKYFPDTQFIVSVRHPVRWFESFYNFRAYDLHPKLLPPTEDLIGLCVPGTPYVCDSECNSGETHTHNICTDRGNFHHSLSRLGKTAMDTEEELGLLRHGMSVVPLKGKVFLMDIAQLNVDDDAASRSLAEDLRDFLGLGFDLQALHERKTGKESHQFRDPERQKGMIDICDEEHAAVRSVLVQNGREAAVWIRDYFLKSQNVVVSSRDRFIEIIEEWGSDPCVTGEHRN